MFSTTAMRNLARPLLHWLQRRWINKQWLLDREQITGGHCQGIRPRVLLSRGLCLYNLLDLGKVPAQRRAQALAQQVRLLSPFAEPGFYARWQGGHAQLWLWDAAALNARLPEAATMAVLPDSALAPVQADGDVWVQGIHGVEWQRWHQGRLADSRWQPRAPEAVVVTPLALEQAAPLQAADRRRLGHLALAGVAGLLVLALLLQAGGALSLWQRQQRLQTELSEFGESSQQQLLARRSARQLLAQYQARQALQPAYQQPFIQQLAAALPNNASFWQRYHFEPGKLQLQLYDDNPDPRDYVRRLGELPGVSNVQIQPDPANGRVVVQANINHKEPS